MSTKPSLNDYGAISTLFKDSLLGIVLSAGGLSTLLPNILEGFSEVRGLATFEALNFFSVVYFLVPVILLTSFWLTRGYRLYIFEKVSTLRSNEIGRWLNSEKSDHEWILLLFSAGVLGKFLPLVLFLINPEWLFKDWIITVWYLTVVFFEIYFVQRRTKKIFESIKPTRAEKESFEQISSSILHMNFLIFFLDLSIGLSLIIFAKPWILYNTNFYILHGITISFYGIVYLVCAAVNIKGITPSRILTVLSIILLSGICLPAVNLKGFDTMAMVIFILLFIILVVFVRFRFDRKGAGLVKFMIYSGLVCGATLLFIWFIVKPGFEQVNETYFENRIQSSQKFSQEELFPLFVFGDSSFYSLTGTRGTPADTEKIMRVASLVDEANPTADLIPITSQQWTKKLGIPLILPTKKATGIDTVRSDSVLQKRFNVRSIYYSEYARFKDPTIKQGVSCQDSLNKFYGSVNTYVEVEVFKRFFKPADSLRLTSKLETLHNYYHPMDYFAYNFKKYREARDSAKTMVRLITRLHSIQQLRESNPLEKNDVIFRKSQENVIEKLKRYYLFNTELSGDTAQLPTLASLDIFRKIHAMQQQLEQAEKMNATQKSKAAAGQLKTIRTEFDGIKEASKKSMEKLTLLKNFHNNYLVFKEINYADRYERAQYIFRSYLTDSQRIGLYIFVGALVVIIAVSIFNERDNQKLSKRLLEDEPDPLPADTPSKSLYIQALVIFILILPLLKKIKPQNIDPEKPYWMMSIQNWYAPVYTAKIIFPEATSSTPKSAGGSNPPGINIQLDSLRKSINALNNTMQTQSTYERDSPPEK